MDLIVNPPREQWPDLCRRNIPADDADVSRAVEEIVGRVAREGDAALRDYARRFDGVELTDLRVSSAEIEAAADAVAADVKAAIERAAANIEAFHAAQLPREITVETMPGVVCSQRPVPLRRVGLYIPGGRAPLFSTVLMLAIPARIAGCRDVVLFTPRGPEGIKAEILYAARVAGVDTVYAVGGAQAIAAMAYGTESILRVDKIFGPGNRFVTKAKQLVSTVCSIDMPAGPSEVMILADSSARPDFVAADMLSQAEHGPDSQAMAVVSDAGIAREVAGEVESQMLRLSEARRASVSGSLSKSRIIVLGSRHEMLEFADLYGAEHLIISLDDADEAAAAISAAGSIFLGNFSPESAGDYASGTNHTLPTGGWARSLPGVNVDSFIHKITCQRLSRDGLASLAPTITAMARAEGLDAHAAAVTIRLKDDDDLTQA